MSNQNVQFAIESSSAGQRLDHVLVDAYPDLSRSRIQKAIERGFVRVNGATVPKHYFVKEGDLVDIDADVFGDLPTVEWWKHVPDAEIPILYEDDQICVINKPIDVVVHPTHAGDAQPSIAAWFVQHMGGMEALEGVGDDPLRPGTVHRLDKPVGGVLVLVKTAEAYEAIKKQFQERTVSKEYRAVVYGTPAQAQGDIRFVLARSKSVEGKMAARPEHAEGRDAWTEYEVLQDFTGRFSYVRVIIHSGRMHQIRAHFAAFDHPIVGDALYGSRHYSVFKKSPHLFLHAHTLGFDHPITGERMTLTAPLPEWFFVFDITRGPAA